MAESLLTTAEVAAVLRVHSKQVYRLVRQGLPARRVGSEWRFSRDEVLAWTGGGTSSRAPGRRPTSPGPDAPAPPALVGANGDLAILSLVRLVNALGPPLLGIVQADMGGATKLLERRAVLAAGAHGGGFPSHLDGERVARIHLVRREIGLVYRRSSEAPVVRALSKLRLASRPESAGVRQHLDRAIRKVGMDPARVHRKAEILHSHLDVALAVASGRADVGLASRAWGKRVGLAFLPLADEGYGLLVLARDLGDPRVVRMCEVAQGNEYRAEVGAVAGYDPEGSGDIRYAG